MKPKLCPCGIRFTPTRSIQKYHSPACEIKHKTGKVESENLIKLPLQVLRDMATGAFQDFIKHRDKDKGCYTCPQTKGVFHAGHAFAKNQFSGMILNEKACKKVCDFCNCVADTDGKIMRAKIQQEIGIVAFIELENEAISTKNKRWSKIEFIEAIEKYKHAKNNAGQGIDITITTK